MNTSEKNHKFIMCSCHSEGLFLDYWDDEKQLYVSLWNLGYRPCKLSFMQRLRYSLKTLFSGQPFNDQIILSKEQMVELKDFLSKIENSEKSS